MQRILILNARLVNEGTIRETDVLVSDGRIERIDGDLSGLSADVVIEAAGQHLLPGLIDDQVHFREPGFPRKADIASESRAAVAGGVTSFMEMPNTSPPTTDAEALTWKFERAAQSSLANYSFYLGATNDNLDEIRAADPRRVCGIKVFMGSSTGNMLVDQPDVLERIFAEAPTLIATHCEDTPTIAANEAAWRERHGDAVPMSAHPEIRSAEACYRSSALAVDLARRHNAHLHVLHISTARELELFIAGPVNGKSITAEACVHHLWFSDADYAELGGRIKCNPAIKSAADREAIRRAVAEDRIDVIATDHAPHTRAEKETGYFQCPSGLPLVQHSLPMLLEMVFEGSFTLEQVVAKTSHAVAERFRIHDRGFLREGYWADLVLVDMERPAAVRPDTIHYKCGWSPLEGVTFRSSVVATLVSGHPVYKDGRFDASRLGHALHFDR